MAVRIRLRRIGKKKQPQYRLVAADSQGPRDGRFIEVIGQYDPRAEPSLMRVNEERALWWLRQGAQPSDRARAILMKTGVWETFAGESGSGRAEAAAPAEEVEELPGEGSEEARGEEERAEGREAEQ